MPVNARKRLKPFFMYHYPFNMQVGTHKDIFCKAFLNFVMPDKVEVISSGFKTETMAKRSVAVMAFPVLT